jgi:hypothetical protein
MGGGSFGNIDWRPLFWLAGLGLIALLVLVLGGGGWAVWWLINHVQIVS